MSPEGSLLIFINKRISKFINERFLASYLSQGWELSDREINSDKIDFYVNFLKRLFPEYGTFVEGRVNRSRAEEKMVTLNIDKADFLHPLLFAGDNQWFCVFQIVTSQNHRL